jgi:2-haloacid dehalogenase
VRTTSMVVFDVNETLSDMRPMGTRFAEIGAPDSMAQLWFTAILRDGFALTAAGGTERFFTLGSGTLRTMLSGATLSTDIEAAIEHVMSAFLALEVHPDVPDGVRALKAGGARLVTLSNGSTEVAERLFTTAGIRAHFDRLLSVDDAGVWKPAPGAYAYAAHTCAADPKDMLLAAVHPWDINGAARAGMRTAWINRQDEPYPSYFLRPDHTVDTVTQLADVI